MKQEKQEQTNPTEQSDEETQKLITQLLINEIQYYKNKSETLEESNRILIITILLLILINITATIIKIITPIIKG